MPKTLPLPETWRQTRPLLVVAALVSTALVLASCGSGSSVGSGSSSGSSGGTAPKSGGTLTFAVSSDAGCVDPQQVGSNDSIYSTRQLVDSLTDQDPATGKIVPWLAQSWTVSPDSKTFTFVLRKGATFSDGTPVNAAAVKADFDAVPKLGPLATLANGYLTGYQGTTVVDDQTAVVCFAQPNAQFLQASSTFSLGLVSLIAVVLLAAAFPGLLSGQDPLRGVPKQKLQGPSGQHLFGTDELGRDLFSRVAHGAVLSLKATVIAVTLAGTAGGLVGLLAGFVGGWLDQVLMRVVDVMLAIPALLLSLAVITALGYGTVKIAIAVGVAILVSAIMGAVSSPRLAIALAQCGGLAFIHQNQPITEQAAMVAAVKRHKAGFRHSDMNIKPTATLGEVSSLLAAAERDVAVVTDDGSAGGLFLGLISTQDFHAHRHDMNSSAQSRMRPASSLVTAPPSISLSDANTLLWDERLDVLPIVNDDTGQLASIVLRRDYELHKQFKNETIDADKQFMVGAGVNTHDYLERIPALVAAGADVLCLDSSDGYSTWQKNVLQFVRQRYGDTVRIGAGNVVDGRGFRYLAEAGADFVKVGIGGGSICITRDQKGIGRGQASALADVVRERDTYATETGEYVPLCSDGGVLHDSHMAIALAFGTDFLMLGRYFARFDESPSPLVRVDGQFFKEYWGEGSQRARNAARYGQGDQLAFEEGVDGYVPYAGSLYENVSVTLSKITSTMISCGSTTLRQFHNSARLVEVSHQSYLQNTEDVRLRDRPSTSN